MNSTARLRQSGMTLIEIMIALLIGAFLLGGVIKIFINAKLTYNMQDNLSKLQENGRFAIDFISKDLRMAGYRGCNRSSGINSILNSSTTFLYNFNTPIQGFEATSATAWTPTIDTAITSPVGGSDVITIRGAGPQTYYVSTHANGAANPTLASSTGLAAGDIVLISACSATNPRSFQISSIATNTLSHAAYTPANATSTCDSSSATTTCNPGNATQSLIESYAGGEVAPINTISYYVRTNPNGQPSLYRRVGNNAAEELVESIENMQILYGEDTDMTAASGVSTDYVPNYYVAANAVGDMLRVVSIRISLTVRTIDRNLTTTGDGRLRHVFTSTIAIRNKLQ